MQVPYLYVFCRFAKLVVPAVACALLLPRAARAQDHWTGIGAISGTVMLMDTTTIVRDGAIRRVWVKSLDTAPKSFLAGRDTLTFDTVIALNEFDCAKGTRTIKSVRYLLGEEVVLDVPLTHDPPTPLRPRSFFGAIYTDLCRSNH
jgi:hypothetical protein